MKKIVSLTIATFAIFTLAACSSQKSDTNMKKTDDSSMMKKDDMKKDEMKSSESDMKDDMKDSSGISSDK